MAMPPIRDRQLRLIWINHFAAPPSEGGGTRHFEVGSELAGLGWRVTIVASDYGLGRKYTVRQDKADRLVYEVQYRRIRFVYLWSYAYLRNDYRRVLNWLTFARSLLKEQSRLGDCDIVVGSSPHLFAAVAGLRIARLRGVPFVLEVRDLWPESLLAVSGKKSIPYYVFAWIAKALYRRADSIICLSRGTQHYLAERQFVPVRKLAFVPNGVDPHGFFARSRNDSDKIELVYAGAHGPANGLDRVIEASSLLSKCERIRFTLIGDGPEKDRLMYYAKSLELANVEFLDSVPKNDVARLLGYYSAGLMVLKDADLFGFGVSPNKLFDYMAAGLPIVCNVPGETAEMVAEANAGIQARDGSAEALADAIRELSSWSAEKRFRHGELGRAWVSKNHSREVLAARLDKVLRETMDSFR